MFNNTKKMSEQELSNASNIIGKGTELDGNLTTTGNLRVEGKVKGSINTKVKVVLGDTSVVEGDIMAQNAEVGGEVHGTIRASGLLILKPTAVIHGDIITAKLIFEEGAKFNGKCNMGGAVKTSKPDASDTTQAKNEATIGSKAPPTSPAKKEKTIS
ncbi:MAG: polymer-forming cytoskeletal protein [Bacteroidota bacterium]